jgi:hypothetical protein
MMTGLAFATCDVPLPPGKAPEWVQLLPGSGTVKGRDGRSWELLDPAGIVLAFEANGADLPVDRFIASSAPAFSRLLEPSHLAALPSQSRQDRAGSELADAICSQLGLKPGSLAE